VQLRRGMGARGGEHACPRQQLAAGRPPQARIERQLEPAGANRTGRGNAERFQFRAPRGGHGSDAAEQRGRPDAERRAARCGFGAGGGLFGGLGEHAPVACQQGRPAGEIRVAAEMLPGAQSRERKRVRERHLRGAFAARGPQLVGQLERAEQAGANAHRHLVGPAPQRAGTADDARVGGGGCGEIAAQRVGEAGGREAVAGGGVELTVHGDVFAACVLAREACRELLRVGAFPPRGQQRAERERADGHRHEPAGAPPANPRVRVH